MKIGASWGRRVLSYKAPFNFAGECVSVAEMHA